MKANFKTAFKKEKLNTIVDQMKYELKGATNTASGLKLVNDEIFKEQKGMRPFDKGVSKFLIVITDGASNEDEHLTISTANAIKKRGVSIISIGIGSAINQSELNGMASNTDLVYNVENYENIFGLVGDILKTICKQSSKMILYNQVVRGKVSKKNYRYYAVDITKIIENKNKKELAIKLENIQGESKIWYSFDYEFPKDPKDLLTISEKFPKGNYIEERRKKRAIKKKDDIVIFPIPPNKYMLYLSVKGYKENNDFQMMFKLEKTSMANTNHKDVILNFLIFYSFKLILNL